MFLLPALIPSLIMGLAVSISPVPLIDFLHGHDASQKMVGEVRDFVAFPAWLSNSEYGKN